MLRDLVDILEVPEFGQRSAEYAVTQLKINSHKDAELLKKAKDMCYKKGFDEGRMIVGEFKGELVKDAKVKTKKLLIDSNQGAVY